MFESVLGALITLGFALIVGTIADLLFKKSDFKWYWNLLFGIIGLFLIGPTLVWLLQNIFGITLPLDVLGLPVVWVDYFWQLVFGVAGTFLLLTVLNLLFWKKEKPSSSNREVEEDSPNRTLPANTRTNRVREDTLSGNEFLDVRDRRGRLDD